MKGEKPCDLVIVSLVGPVDEGNPVVIADGPDHDWRFCRGLNVCIFGKVGTPNQQVARAIAPSVPQKLFLWDVEAKEGLDLLTHIRESSINKRPGEFKPTDWVVTPHKWSAWENKQFEEARV